MRARPQQAFKAAPFDVFFNTWSGSDTKLFTESPLLVSITKGQGWEFDHQFFLIESIVFVIDSIMSMFKKDRRLTGVITFFCIYRGKAVKNI